MERDLRVLPFVFSRTENECWVEAKGEVILECMCVCVCVCVYIYIYIYIYILLLMAFARKIT